MRLGRKDRTEELNGAIIALIIFCLPLGGLIYFNKIKIQSRDQDLETSQTLARNTLEKNQADIEEIRIIQGNQEEINSTWALLNKWNKGGIDQESAKALFDAGFATVAPKNTQGKINQGPRPARPGTRPTQSQPDATKPGEYAQVEGKSNKTEFLRMIRAIERVEDREGLTQVEKLDMSLPSNIPPYWNKATYLDIDLILSTPSTIR
jgi:hypothetical protein